MSEVVHYKGKLEYLNKLPNETLEEQCKRILIENEFINPVSSMCFEYSELLLDYFYNEYIIYGEDLFKVISQEDVDSDNIFIVKNNGDGTYDYEVMYYNGGCGLSEALGYGFEDLNKNVDK